MASPEASMFWTAVPPATWPSPPVDMTVTTLKEIEACPRRWALSSAEYRNLWNGLGYPPRINAHGLAGNVTHLALETITKKLVHAGCFSIEDQNATLVLKELGGLTKVVHECIDGALKRFTENPRALRLLESIRRTLLGQAPRIRTRVQFLLARVRLSAPALPPVASHGSESKHRGPLAAGAFPEVELRAPRIGWKGRADLLVLSREISEITDFKTGEPDETHAFQVQVYALLWALDDRLNPARRLVDRLVLAYEGSDVTVTPLKAEQLAKFEKELVERRVAAESAVSVHPPEARPSVETCHYCAVRHLCQDYWQTTLAQVYDKRVKVEPPIVDLQILITERHGPMSWNGIVELSPRFHSDKQVVFRTRSPQETFMPGDRIRVLDAYLSSTGNSGHDPQPVVVTLTAISEVFLVP